MAGTREGAIARARKGFNDSSFIERLRALVTVPTESHPPLRKHELERYCHDICGPMVQFPADVFALWRGECRLGRVLGCGDGGVVAPPHVYRSGTVCFADRKLR